MRSYVPSAVKVKIFGIVLDSLAKDDFVTIERIDEVTTFREAPDGTRTAFLNKFGTYRVSINVEQTSPDNEWLHLLFKLYQKSGINIMMPLEVSESVAEGGTTFVSLDTFFEVESSSIFSSTTTPKHWVFICHNASYIQRGTSEGFAMADTLQTIVSLIELSENFDLDLSSIQNKITDTYNNVSDKLKNLF